MKSIRIPNHSLVLSASCTVGIAALVFHPAAQAADTVYTNSSTGVNWSAATWTKSGTTTANTFPTTTDAGNVAQNTGTTGTTSTLTLDVPVTIGALYVGSQGTTVANWTITSDGNAAHFFTLNGTGLGSVTASNQAFTDPGVAAIASRSGGTLTINPNIVMATSLDVGTTSPQNGNLTINGNITASAATSLNFRGSPTNASVNGVVTINGNIGASGSAIAVSNLRSSASGTSGNVLINGNLGPSVSTVTQNGVATMILAGTNTYTGATTITSGTLQVGNGGTTGSLPAGSAITDTGNLTFNRSNTVTQGTDFSNAAISGTGGSLTQAGTGTLILNAQNTYTGATTINAGSAIQLGNGGTTGGFTGTTSIVDNGNLIINRGAGNVTQNAGSSIGALISGTGSLTQQGADTLLLQLANTYTGATTINGGTINLGNSTANGSIGTVTGSTAAGGALAMGGGTLNYTRTGGTTQTFASTAINSGGSTVIASVSGDTLGLNALTRNTGGTVDFSGAGAITTTTTNANGTTANTATNGFLGAYATFNKYDWASNNGGTLAAFTGYSYYENVAGWSSNVAGKDVSDDNTGFDGTYTNSITINSLRFNEGNADSTVNVNGGNNLTISSGGILVNPNLGVKYARINGGGLTTGSSADLIIQQNNTGGGHLQIGSSIFGSGGLTKAGVGQLDLNGYDAPYTGVTTVNGGTISLTAAITGTSAVVVNNSGTVLLGANNRINSAATVTLNGGTINTGGFSQGTATGTAAATQGLGALTLSSSSTLDFGSGHTGSSVLAFANSSGQTWSGTLTLADFTVGTDELNFASSTGLTATQLAEISLSGFTATGLDSFGDVTFTAVPEPTTVLGGVLFVGALAWRKRQAVRALLSSCGA